MRTASQVRAARPLPSAEAATCPEEAPLSPAPPPPTACLAGIQASCVNPPPVPHIPTHTFPAQRTQSATEVGAPRRPSYHSPQQRPHGRVDGRGMPLASPWAAPRAPPSTHLLSHRCARAAAAAIVDPALPYKAEHVQVVGDARRPPHAQAAGGTPRRAGEHDRGGGHTGGGRTKRGHRRGERPQAGGQRRHGARVVWRSAPRGAPIRPAHRRPSRRSHRRRR